MPAFPVFAIIFLLFPILELMVMIKVGSIIGVLPTLLLLILGGFLGISLLKNTSGFSLAKFKQGLQVGEMRTDTLRKGVFAAIAGILFLIPGFITDIVALLLLLPFTQHFLIKYLPKTSTVSVHGFSQSYRSQSHSSDIEGEVVARHDETPKISTDRP